MICSRYIGGCCQFQRIIIIAIKQKLKFLKISLLSEQSTQYIYNFIYILLYHMERLSEENMFTKLTQLQNFALSVHLIS